MSRGIMELDGFSKPSMQEYYGKDADELALQPKVESVALVEMNRDVTNRADYSHANEGFEWTNCLIVDSDFSFASFCGGYIKNCEFRNCNFSTGLLDGVLFENCIFSGCDFSRASILGEIFENCICYKCDFFCINHRGGGQIIKGLNFTYSTPLLALQCPEEGSFIAWKVCDDFKLVKLLIPEDARRLSGTTRACRCDKAKVLNIVDVVSGEKADYAYSNYDPDFEYRVGEMVYSGEFDEDRWTECSAGIYFYLSKQEAIMNYDDEFNF